VRIEPNQLDLAVEVAAAILEDRAQHAGIEEERRAQVEAEALGLDRRGAAADAVAALEHGHVESGPSEKHGRGQPAGPGADDHDLARIVAVFHSRAPLDG